MILFCGIPSEPSLRMVFEKLNILAVPYLVFNQRHFANMKLEFRLINGKASGWMQYDGEYYRLEQFIAIYSRLMDFRFLPELESEPPGSAKFEYCRILHDALVRWCEIAPARVVNRPSPMGSNYSKPFQAQLIRKHNFLIPETLITNDPSLAYEFFMRHKKVIYKSISSIRSIVQTLEEKDITRLNLIRLCPVQFQEFIDGVNVRVHTIGRKAIATSIHSGITDYRYSYIQGEEATLKAIELPGELAEKCINLSEALGLTFAGVDLKIAPDNKVYCLEVNPSPAFSYYENATKQPIALSVAKYLAGID
jgi:hypothetical protein